MPRGILYAFLAATLCLTLADARLWAKPDGDPPDTCIVEFSAPTTATLSIAGKDYGTKRRFTYAPLEPNQLYPQIVTAQLGDGTEVRRKIFLKAGRRLNVTLARQAGAPVEPVIQLVSSRLCDAHFSPDGKRLLASYEGEVIILWDVARGLQLRRYTIPEAASRIGGFLERGYVSLAFDGTGDSFVACTSHSATVFETDTGRIRQVFNKPAAVALDPFGRKLYQLNGMNVTTWDIDSGRKINELKVSDKSCTDMQINHAGTRLLICELQSTTASVIDLADGKAVAELTGEREPIRHMRFSSDDRHILTAHVSLTNAGTSTGVVWDASTGRSKSRHPFDSFGRPSDAAFINKSAEVCINSSDGKPILYAVGTDVAISNRLTERLGMFEVHSQLFADLQGEFLAFEGDGGIRVVRTSDGSDVGLLTTSASTINSGWISQAEDRVVIATGNLKNGTVLLNTLSGQPVRWSRPEYFNSLSVSADTKHLLTSYDSSPNEATLWNVDTAQPISHFPSKTGARESLLSPSADCFVMRESTGYDAPSEINLWNSTTGSSSTLLAVPKTGQVDKLCFSSDGRYVGVRTSERAYDSKTKSKSMLWSVESKQLYRSMEGLSGLMVLSNDSRYLLSEQNGLGIWDLESGRRTAIFDFPNPNPFAGLYSIAKQTGVLCVALSPTNDNVTFTSDDGGVCVWDPNQDSIVTRWRETFKPIALAISPNGRLVATGGLARQITIRDTGTGELVRELTVPRGYISSLAFNDEGTRLVTGGSFKDAKDKYFGDVIVWNIADGQMVRKCNPSPRWIDIVCFMPDGQSVFGRLDNNTFVVHDIATGNIARRFESIDRTIGTAAMSRDGLYIVGISEDGFVVWDVQSGRQVHSSQARPGEAACFSPNSNEFAAAERFGAVSICDTRTGQVKHRLFGHRGPVNAMAYSADGMHFAIGSTDGSVSRWSTKTWQRESLLAAHFGAVTTGTFSSRSDQVATGGSDGRIVVWDKNGGVVCVLNAHSQQVSTVAFVRNDEMLFSTSRDGTAALWDLHAGEELARIVIFGDDWIITTPQGLFDGSAVGRTKMMYRVGRQLNVVPVDRFFQDFYHPGLLAAIWRGERPLPKANFAEQAAPLVAIESPKSTTVVESKEVTVETRVVDQGGGVKGPWLVHNGARITAEGERRSEGKTVRQTFRVALLDGENRLEVRAASADGSWEAEPASLLLRLEKAQVEAPAVHVVAVGINRYSAESMSLKYAAPDAQALADVFAKRGPALYGKSQTSVVTLIDAEATTAGIRTALEKVAAKCNPQDTVIVFLAGHGITIGQRYYFLPHEFTQKSERFEDDVRRDGLPADVLGDWLSRVPALRRVLILDTCQSGGALSLAGGGGRDPFAFRGALERLSHATGTFTIAAAPANDQAQEATQLKHGVLTYALLAGLGAVNDGPLNNQKLAPSGTAKVVEVRDWFNYAQDKVPLLTKLYFGQEQFVGYCGQGTSFPILPLGDP